jgi:hypothetical protein
LSSPYVERDSRIAAARSFARSLNILLRYVRLYGSTHKLTVSQFESAWNDLRSALPDGDDNGFLLGVSDGKLLIDGVPLDSTLTERSFADLLMAAGVSSMYFSSKAGEDDLRRLLLAFTGGPAKPADMAERLKRALGENEGTIHVNEIRYVAQDADLIADSFSVGLTARALGGDASRVREWLTDPQKLLQLIAAAEGSEKGNVSGQIQEADWNRVMGVLTNLAKAAGGDGLAMVAAREELAQTPLSAQEALKRALAALAAQAPDAPDPNVLVKAAEHMAIQFALERYERGEVRVNAIREMIDGMAKQLDTLRQVLKAHEDKMSRAGIIAESHADILDRQFWAGVPDSGKRTVLESADAWCIPPRNVRSFVEELQQSGDSDVTTGILYNYAKCVRSADSEARQKTADGLTQLADLYASSQRGLLRSAIKLVGDQLNDETSLELQTVLAAALIRLTHEAGASHDYESLQQAVVCVHLIKHHRPSMGDDLSRRIGFSARLPKLIEESVARQEIPGALIDFLNCDPGASIKELAGQYGRAQRKEDRAAIVELANRLGPAAHQCLADWLHARPAAEAIAGIGLLAHFDFESLRRLLPLRLPEWGRAQHDDVVCQIAATNLENRGGLLLELLDRLNPLSLARALDEIAISGEQAAFPRLLNFAEGILPETWPTLLQVKAIEALGCLRDQNSISLMHELVRARSVLAWKYPREVRVVAAQTLLKIDAKFRDALRGTGLTDFELEVSPLDPSPENGWLRHRRYPRIAPTCTIKGAILTSRNRCGVVINLLSLGGGHATRDGKVLPGSDATLELHWGIRRLKSRVVVRQVGQSDLAFEIVDMDLNERWKLRRLLAEHVRYQPEPQVVQAADAQA